jgi:hypothetical protein
MPIEAVPSGTPDAGEEQHGLPTAALWMRSCSAEPCKPICHQAASLPSLHVGHPAVPMRIGVGPQVHPGSHEDSSVKAIDIYGHIDLKELKEAYLAAHHSWDLIDITPIIKL